MSRRQYRGRPQWRLALLASSLLLGVEAAAFEMIGFFAGEGADPIQNVTEVHLENGEVIRIVYSQGTFAYLSDMASDGAADLGRRSLISLSNPQLSGFFIPGLFGYTASGGPEVEQRELVIKTNLTDTTPSKERHEFLRTPLTKLPFALPIMDSKHSGSRQTPTEFTNLAPARNSARDLIPAQATPPSYSDGFQLNISAR